MFGISKRVPPVARAPPTRSAQVRILWVEFEVWHAARLDEIENKVQAALKELEQKSRTTKSRRQKKDSKELDEEKTKKRLELEKTLNGNVVRQEWDKRLRDAGLQSEDWVDMTEEEQRKVEMILGADLELEEVEELPRIPETYAVVDPNTFHLTDDSAWLEVKQTLRSDDQLSLEASTTSSTSSTSDLWSTPAYNSWSSEASRSSAQSSQNSSPELHSSKYLASDASSSSSRPSTSSHSRSKSHGYYIGPQLASDSEADDNETSFEKFKLSIRIQKIREFHEEAADADIRLTVNLDEARRRKNWTKEEESQRVRAHEADILALRERKENERKAAVDAERQKRRAELRQLPTEQDLDSRAQTFLNNLQLTLERDAPAASETPTIRQSAFPRARKQSFQHLHQQDWAESGNDTPTPSTRPSGWSLKKDKVATSASNIPASAFGDAPPLKRLATAPAAVPPTLKNNLSLSLSVFEESAGKASTIGQPEVTSNQTKKASQLSAPTSAISVLTPAPAPASAAPSKKSKKEKTKSGKKTSAVSMELTENVEETPQQTDDSHTKMPGQWGWGEDLPSSSGDALHWAAISSSAAPAFTPVPSALSSSFTSSSSSHPLYAAQPAASTSAVGFIPPSISTTAPAAPHTIQVPDNRRVWLPPGALEANLNNKSRDTKLKQSEPPMPIQKSVSGPLAGSAQSKLVPGPYALFDAPAHIQKSVSGPPEYGIKPGPNIGLSAVEGSRGSQAQGKMVEVNREVREVPEPLFNATNPISSSSSKSSPAAPVTKVPAPTPPVAVVAPPLAKSSSSSSTSSKRKSKGKKKVTIEEAQDEELGGLSDEDKAKGIERLPVDSRYIMESISEPKAPKPVVSEPQSRDMFKGVFEYDNLDTSSAPAATSTFEHSRPAQTMRQQQQQQHDMWTPLAPASIASSSSSTSAAATHDRSRWIPGMPDSTKKQEKQEKKVRWTPNAYSYAAPEPKSGAEDVFLSALDSLEAVIRGGGEAGKSSGSSSSSNGVVDSGVLGGDFAKWGMGMNGNNKKPQMNRTRTTMENTDERLWQHPLSSLGRGASNLSATSAI